MKLMKGIYCYYLPIEQVMEVPESIQNAPYSTDMHILKCLRLEDRSQGLESIAFSFFTLSVIKRPSMTPGTKELTERNLLVISTGTLDQDEIETTCAKSATGENGPDWIKCPRCSNGAMMVAFMYPKNTFYLTF